jgi:uncharacterized protein with GYD domain
VPHYLVQASYTSEALAALTKNPTNRLEMLEGLMKSVGGRVEAAYFSFGDYDITMVIECPDNQTAAGLSIGVAGRGAIKNIKTTPLLTGEEAVAAMQVAGRIDYQPPA